MAPICYHTSLRQRSNCFSIIYNSHPSKCHRHDYDEDYDDDYDEIMIVDLMNMKRIEEYYVRNCNSASSTTPSLMHEEDNDNHDDNDIRKIIVKIHISEVTFSEIVNVS